MVPFCFVLVIFLNKKHFAQIDIAMDWLVEMLDKKEVFLLIVIKNCLP